MLDVGSVAVLLVALAVEGKVNVLVGAGVVPPVKANPVDAEGAAAADDPPIPNPPPLMVLPGVAPGAGPKLKPPAGAGALL
jgi:hypothetical protein